MAKDQYKVEVSDKNPAMRGHLCAWGCFHSQLKVRLGKVGLNVEDCILSKVDRLVLNGIDIKVKNQVSIDKPHLLEDLLPRKEVVKREPKNLKPRRGELMINATTQPLGEYLSITMIQYKSVLKGLDPNTAYEYISPHYTGYAWAFPLSDNGKLWHLGACCIGGDPLDLIRQIAKRYKFVFEIPMIPVLLPPFCSCRRDLKIVDPEKVVLSKDGVISVGEAAGVVQPLSGEGIIPTMDSAELLYESLSGGESYEAAMKVLLKQYEELYRIFGLIRRHRRLAYLKGFRQIAKRAEEGIHAELTTTIKLRLLKEILF